jgi:hypothetical protein
MNTPNLHRKHSRVEGKTTGHYYKIEITTLKVMPKT